MRLPVFLLLAFVLSLAVGLVFGFVGAGFWPSVLWAVIALVVLQIGYFLFLMLAMRKANQSKAANNGD